METPRSHEVTGLLQAWSAGDEEALQKLTPLVYRDLHRAARHYMAGERTGHTLQATALINEVYLRLIDARRMDWQNRAHFFAVCAQLMRRILTDFARSRRYHKRGGGAAHIPLNEALVVGSQPDSDLVVLDDALRRLSLVDERKSRVVELRFFGGLDVKETAAVLKVSNETVMRDWRLAKVWLLRDLSGTKQHGS
ncbi:MAG: sigma-70 family RNA polymerase sigma factor [Acidobacteriia bacterium]|nr:sigma-70 family RNA polymerase sigma factor [Terriglobia bacterium]